jgi:hypothetical protein
MLLCASGFTWVIMKRTCRTIIRNSGLHAALDAMCGVMNQLKHDLFVDLIVRGGQRKELKRQYIAERGITGRQFHGIFCDLRQHVEAARGSAKFRVDDLGERIAAAAKNIASLEKDYAKARKLIKVKTEAKAAPAALAGGKKPNKPKRVTVLRRDDSQQAVAARARLRFTLHQKKRRLASLERKLEAAQETVKRPVPKICFGSRALFSKQLHAADNGYRHHWDWLEDWQDARTSQFFIPGTGIETGGNQTAALRPDGTLRLRMPPCLEDRFGAWIAIADIRFGHGHADVFAASRADVPLSWRFIRRTVRRRGRDEVRWYAHVTDALRP